MKVWETNTIQIQQQYREAKPLMAAPELFNPLQDILQNKNDASTVEKSSSAASLQENTIDLII